MVAYFTTKDITAIKTLHSLLTIHKQDFTIKYIAKICIYVNRLFYGLG
jgi:hypothetical protein